MKLPPFIRNHPRTSIAVTSAVVLIGAGIAAYFIWFRPRLPGPETYIYHEYADNFEIGTAALEVGLNKVAEKHLTLAIRKIPQEPAAWANRGLLRLRQNQLSEAESDLNKAHELAPGDPDIEILLGLLARAQAKYDDAVAHFRKAIDKRPHDLAILYTLAKLVQAAAAKGSDKEYQDLIERILKQQPFNMIAMREWLLVASQRADRDAVEMALKRYDDLAPQWRTDRAEQARSKLRELKEEAKGPLPGDLPGDVQGLDNLLKPEQGYSRSSNALEPDVDFFGTPLRQFLRLYPLRNGPAPADFSSTFTVDHQLKFDRTSGWDFVAPIWLGTQEMPAIIAANAREVRRMDGSDFSQEFPSGPQKVPPTASGVLPIDWNNDQRTDLLLAGAGGLRFLQQDESNLKVSFTDVTDKTKLDKDVLQADYYGAWAADTDMDGQLDIILAPRKGEPFVLRNNGDGTFLVLKPFSGIDAVRAFAWGDIDNDGAADAVFLDAQAKLRVFTNERSRHFNSRTMPDDLGKLTALTIADLNDDGIFDIVALRDDGTVLLVSDRDKGEGWEVKELFRWKGAPGKTVPGDMRLIVGDFDNNGAFDVAALGPEGGQLWLNEGQGKFTPLDKTLPGRIFAAEDIGRGRLDFLALSETGEPVYLRNEGEELYHSQSIRATANPNAEGDNRINSFTIGSEVEIRTGLMIQKQRLTSPRTHFGLGEQTVVHIMRFVWTNGAVQIEFNKCPDDIIRIQQRLTASCPFLFTYDGTGMQFATDCMWTSPLGMFINGQNSGGITQTEDWIKIRGDQLAPRDGSYDVRIQANLWETHFFDHLALKVVDHPADTEIFVDERFAIPPVKQEVHVTSRPRPVAKAWDHYGHDVTDIVRAIDGRYLDSAGRGKYQGVTNEHWVEVDLGDDAPREGPVWLLAHGWLHPTDSSINVALSQGEHEQPHGLVLEVPDPDKPGTWKIGRDNLGMPAGKNKTIMIRLDGITGKEVTRRFRLRTNMEIYWDALQYATGLDGDLAHVTDTKMQAAELRYRGFLQMTRASDSSPELPHYDKIETVRQKWRDLIGYYTRYGDVLELLEKVDDRYVIVNAGDEIAMRFAVPTPPPKGWKRDFVWVSDGWVKDGNLNTGFSKTVLPLPYHDMTAYDRAPGRLVDDPVYQRFPDDWKKYHTRYVTPSAFERGLRR